MWVYLFNLSSSDTLIQSYIYSWNDFIFVESIYNLFVVYLSHCSVFTCQIECIFWNRYTVGRLVNSQRLGLGITCLVVDRCGQRIYLLCPWTWEMSRSSGQLAECPPSFSSRRLYWEFSWLFVSKRIRKFTTRFKIRYYAGISSKKNNYYQIVKY